MTLLLTIHKSTNIKPEDIELQIKARNCIYAYVHQTESPKRTVDTAQVWFVGDWVSCRITYCEVPGIIIPISCDVARYDIYIEISYISLF